MTARELIKSVLRICQVIGQGENKDGAAEESEAFTALNSLLASLSGTKLMVYEVVTDSHTLDASTSQYTIGPGGDINVARPVRVVDAFVRDSGGIDCPVKVVDRTRFNDFAVKTSPGRPRYLYYEPEYPLGKINLYYTPNAAETLFIDSWKPLTQISAVTDSLNIPLEYERFLKFQLAIDLAPEHSYDLPDSVFRTAKDTKRELKALNITPPPQAKFDGLLSRTGRRYNIYGDGY